MPEDVESILAGLIGVAAIGILMKGSYALLAKGEKHGSVLLAVWMLGLLGMLALTLAPWASVDGESLSGLRLAAAQSHYGLALMIGLLIGILMSLAVGRPAGIWIGLTLQTVSVGLAFFVVVTMQSELRQNLNQAGPILTVLLSLLGLLSATLLAYITEFDPRGRLARVLRLLRGQSGYLRVFEQLGQLPGSSYAPSTTVTGSSSVEGSLNGQRFRLYDYMLSWGEQGLRGAVRIEVTVSSPLPRLVIVPPAGAAQYDLFMGIVGGQRIGDAMIKPGEHDRGRPLCFTTTGWQVWGQRSVRAGKSAAIVSLIERRAELLRGGWIVCNEESAYFETPFYLRPRITLQRATDLLELLLALAAIANRGPSDAAAG